MNLNEHIVKFSNEQKKRIENNGDTRTEFLKARITKKEMNEIQEAIAELNISQSSFLRSLLNFYQINKTNL